MSLTALTLVLIAAFAHSTWNLLAKRAAHSTHLIWFASVGGTVILFPLAAWTLTAQLPRFGLKATLFLLSTAILHVLYFESLQRGYRAGDLSVVYPLARGTGPLLSFFGATLLLRERPSLLAAIGALLVVSGVIVIAGGVRSLFRSRDRAGLFWGVTTGAIIAAYTLNDGYAVKVLLVSPILVDYASTLFRLIVSSPRTWRERALVPMELRLYWKESLAIAVLAPLGYILVLFAMKIAPITHIAPAREMSMMIGAYFGTKLLDEGNAARRLFASALIASGVFGLVVG